MNNSNIQVTDDIELALNQLGEAHFENEPDAKHIKVNVEDLPAVFESVKSTMLESKKKYDGEALLLRPIVAITNEEHLKSTRKAITIAKKSADTFSEMRLATTRPIDGFKKDLITVERQVLEDLQKEIDRTKALCDTWEVTEAKRVKAEQERIARETAKKQELERIGIDLKAEAEINATRHITKVTDEIRARFEAWTLANFDANNTMLNGYKPMLIIDSYKRYFTISFNEQLVSYTEYSDKVNKAMEYIPFEIFAEKYRLAINVFVDEIKSKAPQRKQELEKLAELEKTNAEAARLQREAAAKKQEDDRLEREANTKKREEEKREQANVTKEVASLNVELGVQTNMQSVGTYSVKKNLVKATVIVPSAYGRLLEFYLKNMGDTSKLDFLATFACTHGQPQISGVTYNV